MQRARLGVGLTMIVIAGCGKPAEQEGNETQNESHSLVIGSNGQILVRADNGVYVSTDGRVTHTTADNGVIVGSDGTTIVRSQNGVYVGSNGTTFVVVDGDGPGSQPSRPDPVVPSQPRTSEGAACLFPDRASYTDRDGITYFKLDVAYAFITASGYLYHLVADNRCVDADGDS